MSGPTIEFWFSIGSTYTYLTAMRLEEVAKSSGVEVLWRPFSVRAVMIEQKNIPFMGKPVKMAYMWRDIERRAEAYGFPARVPAALPARRIRPGEQGRHRCERGGMGAALCARILSPLVPGGRGAGPRAEPQKRSCRDQAEPGPRAGESLKRSGRASLPGGDRGGEAAERLRFAELRRFRRSLLGRRPPRRRNPVGEESRLGRHRSRRATESAKHNSRRATPVTHGKGLIRTANSWEFQTRGNGKSKENGRSPHQIRKIKETPNL